MPRVRVEMAVIAISHTTLIHAFGEDRAATVLVEDGFIVEVTSRARRTVPDGSRE